MKEKLAKIIKVFTVVMLGVVVTTPQVMAENSIKNVTELNSAIEAANNNDTLVLSSDFVGGSAQFTINKNITIEGSNAVWGKGSLVIKGTGDVLIKNLEFDGNSINGGYALDVDKSSGAFEINTITFNNAQNGAMRITSGAGSQNYIDKTLFNGTRGRALSLGAMANVDINQSSFTNTLCIQSGYECGAVVSKNYEGTLNVNNTVFDSNVNGSSNTGVLGGGGGALSFNNFLGNLNISQSIFKNNSTHGKDVQPKSTYDGGAIYLFNVQEGSSIKIEQSSFIENIAYDDGGAILIQTTGKNKTIDKIDILNNTFYGNKAYGTDNGVAAGGAIQVFVNSGFLDRITTKARINGNTFAYNSVGGHELSETNTDAAAIGITSLRASAKTEVSLSDNLFVGNNIVKQDGKIIYGDNDKNINVNDKTKIIDKSNNIGFFAKEENMKAILGNYPTVLSSNQSQIKAGVEYEIVPTLPWMPEGLADNSSNIELAYEDQHNTARYKDSGSVELSHIKYNANGGLFTPTPITEYNGQVYYELIDGTTKDYYIISKTGDNTATLANILMQPEKEGYHLLGWAKDENASIPDYEKDDILDFENDNTTLYAVWEKDKIKYTVEYNDGVNGEIFNTELYTVEENEPTPNFSLKNIEREGYTFDGWSPKVEDKVTKDIVYTAQWTKITKLYTVQYKDGVNGEIFKTESYTVEENNPTPNFSLKNIEREGYTFDGWNPKVEDKVTKDIIYTAQWKLDDTVVPPVPVEPGKPTNPKLPTTGQMPIAKIAGATIITGALLGLLSSIRKNKEN